MRKLQTALGVLAALLWDLQACDPPSHISPQSELIPKIGERFKTVLQCTNWVFSDLGVALKLQPQHSESATLKGLREGSLIPGAIEPRADSQKSMFPQL